MNMSIISLTLLCFCYILITPSNAVLYPPSFVFQPPKDTMYQKNEALMLRCVATGNPPPQYMWTKNDKVFDFSINVGRYTQWPNEGTLIFALPNDDDDGIYQCIAYNDRGRAYSSKSNVRRAEFQEFQKKDIEKITVRQGDPLILRCPVPVSYPVPIVAWQKSINEIPILIKESSKYVMDIDGNLYLTGVTMEDNNFQFTCTVFNQRMRIGKIDHPFQLTVIPSQANTGVDVLFQTLQPAMGRIGERLILRCILSGNPAPTYKWSMKGTTEDVTLRPNVNIDAGGAILIIDPVTLGDGGIYECLGENIISKKPIVIDFAVDIEMVPKLTMKLSDYNVPYNGSCIFKCEAIGIPPPKITWTVNGLGLDTYLNGINKKQIGNTIYLSNLEPKDSAVFQCNASSPIGSDYSNGYVNVLRDKPEFIVGPQAILTRAENTPGIITCQSFSAPKAIVTWSKDGFAISGGRYMVQDNGDLMISKLITADSGNYTCTATNLYGSVSGSCMLYVRQRTELMILPVNTWVYFGQEVKFVCTAKTDRLETQNLKIIWYKDNSVITLFENDRINTNLQDNSLIISGAQTTDTGIYTCNATNGLDFVVAYASLIVQSKPHTPIKIDADCDKYSNNNQALISWDPGADNYAPIIAYIIEYSTQYDRKGWYEVDRVTQETGNTGETVELRVKMMPHIDYRFRVRAMNRVGISEPSDPTIKECKLLPSVPTSNPTELYLYGTMVNNLVIQWTPMTYVEHNGRRLGYDISVTCIDCKTIPNNIPNTTYISDWDQNIITYNYFQIGTSVYDIESFRLFKGTIRAKNELGVSSKPDTEAFGYSGDASPSISGTDLVITAGTPGKGYVPLSWNIIAKENVPTLVNGFFRGYRIEWCLASLSEAECDLSTQYQDVILQTQTLPVLFGNKRRKRSAEEFLQNEEDYSRFDTKHRQVIPNNPSTPINFQVLSRSKRAVATIPDKWQYGGNITVKLTMIPGNTQIKIWLRVLNSIYASARSDPVLTLTTFEDTPGPVINFRVLTLGINHVDLEWKMPIETNGIITGYRLGWREIIGLELGYMTTYPDLNNPVALRFQMSGLKSDTMYRILIWALTSQGSGVESFVDIRTQPANIAPNAPKFTISSIVNNTVNVTFAPSDTGVKGSVFFAQYRKVGQYRWDESEPQYIRTWIFIGNLANDTYYEIRIVATNGAGMATPSVASTFRTYGTLDPTRPVNNNAIWIVMVILILIFTILLFIFMLWYREKTMERLVGKPVNDPNTLYQAKTYDSLKQPLYSGSQMGSSMVSNPLNTNMQVPSVISEGSVIDSFGSQPSEALIKDNDELPPVNYHQRPRIKKKKHRPVKPESEADEDDAII